MLHKKVTGLIIKSYYQVYNQLGYGFLEKVYEKALLIELQNQGLDAKEQYPIKVTYQDVCIGEYFADLYVADNIIVELKAAEFISLEHELQLINYLRATDVEIGLLLNFGRKPEFKRKIYSNENKNSFKPAKASEAPLRKQG